MKQAIVIGAGIGGLAASVRLALKGYSTAVYETAAWPGGKLHEFKLGAYRFDAGPSLFTRPGLIDELFVLAGKDPRQYFQYKPLETTCHYFYPDGIRFEAPSKPEEFSKKAAETFGVDAQKILKHLQKCDTGLQTAGKIFLEKSLHRADTWLSTDVLRTLTKIPQLDLLKSLHQSNTNGLNEPHLVQLFDRFATYNGSDPYRSPGMMKVIAALEHGEGSFYPEGGMYAITKAVWKLAEELGVQFHFNHTIDEILVEQGKARGIRMGSQSIMADVVVSNMDVVPTYRKLLSKQKAPERSLNQERSSSAFIFYWGLNTSFDELGVHNIFFSEDYRAEFAHLFNQNDLYHDPTVYVNISSKYAPPDAPEGNENWFVMVNAPHDRQQDWDQIRPQLKAVVIQKLEKILGKSVGSHIEQEEVLNPRAIALKTSSYLGALYGSSSNNMFSAFMRHPNFSRKIKNLYFCGGSVHPGGGIPLAVLSAKIATDHIPHA